MRFGRLRLIVSVARFSTSTLRLQAQPVVAITSLV
jgi:hypothetical protein